MKTGEILHGFIVERSEFLPEADGTLWYLKHKKLNTPLCFLERADSNKSFYIAFKTPPEDSTGVFHIIEHSVLCGSEKFPVKEPFVELLKSSLKTFLNAMTYQDRTVYPVSSRSDRDFLNLVDVYMDAVLHPLMLENENIFMQEGHRFELSEDGELSANGVVYNEMKGAMSSPDGISSEELLTLLYPDSPFGKNSGGDPDEILKLSYEDFCRAHKKHYHPSSAMLFLDGEVNLDEVLPLLDSYLSEYEPREDGISVGAEPEIKETERTVEYEISPEEDEGGKLRAYLGVRTFDFSELERAFLLSVVTDAIAATNESPLVKPFLDGGICEDVTLFPLGSGLKWCSYGIELKNLSCTPNEAYALLSETLEKIADGGIGKERLEASLNLTEFKLREKDFGSMPKGLVFGLSMLDTWVYGEDPALGLKYEKILASVREKLNTGAPEALLREVFIENRRAVKLVLSPSKTLAEKREAKEREFLDGVRASLSDDEYASLQKKNETFREWQNSPDSEENLNTLPSLSVKDIPTDVEIAPTELSIQDGIKVLLHELPTGGITYADLIFDVSDLGGKDLALVSVLSSLLGKCKTAKHSADELTQTMKSKLGSFYAASTLFLSENSSTPALHITVSALDTERSSIINIADEILNTTDFSEKTAVKNILVQSFNAKKERFTTSGHAAAIRRARAYVSSSGVVAEELLGYEMYKNLKELIAELECDYEKFSEKLSCFLKKIITKKRLICAYTGTPCEEFAKKLAKIPKTDGCEVNPLSREPYGLLNEGFVIPSRTAYIGRSANFADKNIPFTGSMYVLSNILSYTYLWSEVRVKGGAYGAGFSLRRAGDCSIYSYRDPNPAASLAAAEGCGKFLRDFAQAEDSFDSYIIGTLGDYDILHTPRSAGEKATDFYMTGKTPEGESALRASMLTFDKAELLRLADITDEIMQESGVCVFGSREQIESCKHLLKAKVEL